MGQKKYSQKAIECARKTIEKYEREIRYVESNKEPKMAFDTIRSCSYCLEFRKDVINKKQIFTKSEAWICEDCPIFKKENSKVYAPCTSHPDYKEINRYSEMYDEEGEWCDEEDKEFYIKAIKRRIKYHEDIVKFYEASS